MTSAQTETTFPLDWNEWRAEWAEWKNAHDLKRPRENPWRYKDKNFLADAILGVYRVNGRTVELSEVTMPNFGARPREDFGPNAPRKSFGGGNKGGGDRDRRPARRY